jgi:hypothetical protein
MDNRNFRVTKAFTADLVGEVGIARPIPAGSLVQIQEWITPYRSRLRTAHFWYEGHLYHAQAGVVYESLQEAAAQESNADEGGSSCEVRATEPDWFTCGEDAPEAAYDMLAGGMDDLAHAEARTQEDGRIAVSLVLPCLQTALPQAWINLSPEQARALAESLLDAALLVEEARWRAGRK